MLDPVLGTAEDGLAVGGSAEQTECGREGVREVGKVGRDGEGGNRGALFEGVCGEASWSSSLAAMMESKCSL